MPQARADLEAITHPRSAHEVAELGATLGGPYQLIAVPLLAETGTAGDYDRVLVVDCDPQLQLQRLMLRDGRRRADAQRMIDAQATREARLAIADDVIPTTATSTRWRRRSRRCTSAISAGPCSRDIANGLPLGAELCKIAGCPRSPPPSSAPPPQAAVAPLIFEQPLNERMRTFLRLDYLYNQALYHNEKASQWGSRAAMTSLIDILAITTRSDVRSEVLKEIERHLAQLGEFEDRPEVDGGRLRALINNLVAAAYGAGRRWRRLPAAAARFGVPRRDQAPQRHSRRHLRVRPAGLSSSG